MQAASQLVFHKITLSSWISSHTPEIKVLSRHRPNIHTRVVIENSNVPRVALDKMQAALHREDHHHVGPSAVVPLQYHPPPDGVKPPELDLTQDAL
jgi:hypothetical protein